MPFCYEFFNCHDYKCIRRKQLDKPCWEIKTIVCERHGSKNKETQDVQSKEELCKQCAFYQYMNKRS